ncbi:hypothetical protein [Mycetocola sp. 2940]|uniref:hypothetical protein n=1 Tax=Mycetocola sp. 2940 TaxID=3156452 RepID=UPI003391CF74
MSTGPNPHQTPSELRAGEALLTTEPQLHTFGGAPSGKTLSRPDLANAREAGSNAAEDFSRSTSSGARRPVPAGDDLWHLIMGEQRREDFEAGALAMLRQEWEHGYEGYL